MEIVSFLREFMSVESTTWNEGAACRWLRDYLSSAGFEVTTQQVSDERVNVLAKVGDPLVTFSSHIDTVPPYIAPSEDEQNVYGRGACDAKGVIAAQVFAAQRLRDEGLRDFGMLYVVGEEDGSDGARVANELPNRNRFLINGEPTESHQATASKGALRVVIEATGKTAHAAYPEYGESAIEKLLDVLNDIRRMNLPTDAKLGATTYNIGTISGGRKPNVVPDFASSEIMFRTVTHPDEIYQAVVEVAAGRAEVRRGFSLVPIHINTVTELAHIPTNVVRFGTDIPCLTNWGEPLLFGPGSIHDAHTTHEFISKAELKSAVDVYAQMGRILLKRANS
ncbi:MAG TPA: M20/M25/M40 family metallo-hydrolase [Blastocatellia bacterium]|nr:M20/M25/M40 family metallo-hydrolase [Blastocatellia bacterium]